jgi:hypothetical protein
MGVKAAAAAAMEFCPSPYCSCYSKSKKEKTDLTLEGLLKSKVLLWCC